MLLCTLNSGLQLTFSFVLKFKNHKLTTAEKMAHEHFILIYILFENFKFFLRLSVSDFKNPILK